MKKLMMMIMALAFLAGCSDYSDLDKRVAKLEKRGVMDLATGAGANFYPCRGLGGSATGALGKIASPALGDSAFVVLNEDASYGNALFVYVYTDYGAAVSAASPYEIKPETGASENYAWSLVYSSVSVPVVATGNITLTLGQMHAGAVQISGPGTVSLQGAAIAGFGTAICVYVEDITETVSIESVVAADIINLSGTPLNAGNVIDSPGGAGDFMCLISTTDADGAGVDGYLTLGYGKTAWTDGGTS